LVDAASVAVSVEAVRIDASSQASVQMDTSPDSPSTASTNLVSLWQSDLRALLVERFLPRGR
jgi:hypothetical protein